MNYRKFLSILNEPDFDKNMYLKLVEEYGYSLIHNYFSEYINDNSSEESFEKTKYYLEDQLDRELFQVDVDSPCLDSERQYLNEISGIPLLKPEEERNLLIKINELREKINEYKEIYDIKELVNKYGKVLDKLDNIDSDDIKVLKNYLKKLKEYRLLSNKIIESNLRLVVFVAKSYKVNSIDNLDLIQEGNLGIKKAIEKFDLNKGNRFSTYAIWWIRQRVVREIHQNSRIVRLPVHRHELLHKINKVTSLYERQYGETPTSEEILKYIDEEVQKGNLKNSKFYNNLSVELLEKLKNISQNVVSLNTLVGDNEDTTLEEFIIDEKQESVESVVLKGFDMDNIRTMLDEVKSRFKLVIILRFGFSLSKYMSYEEFLTSFLELEHTEEFYKKLYISLCKNPKVYTLEQIAAMYDVTRERIRQMEAKALRMLKNKNKAKKILQPDSLDLYK